MTHEPLVIRAHVSQEIVLREPLALDALLMALVARRDRLPPFEVTRATGGSLELPIPVAQAHGVYLATCARPTWAARELRQKNRRAPIEQLARLSTMRTKVDVSSGPNKAYRTPYEAGLLSEPLTWWCLGEREGVEELLLLCTRLGRHIGSGYGRVDRWEVERCEPWPGFPAVRDGAPLRNLPLDYPGVVRGTQGWAAVRPPYWEREAEEACWVVR